MNSRKGSRTVFALSCLALMLGPALANGKPSSRLPTDLDFAAIDAYVTMQRNDLRIPGMALGIVQGDEIVHLQGFGVADSSGRKVTPQTPFYIASNTKSFTALAVMQLVEAGKIDLDAPVQDYLPWFELADQEASARITVRNLLNQTTGITRMDGAGDRDRDQPLEEMMRGLHSVLLTQPVGSTFQYSNLNYILAGLIVEKVSGQTYADYLTQHILEPLDMRHSYTSRPAALADGLSEGHGYVFGFVVPRAVSPHAIAGGGLIASVEDLTHYAIAHLNGGRYDDTSVLSPQGIAELHKAPSLANKGDHQYAMGWNVSTFDGTASLEHLGALSNFTSSAILLPERGWGVVLLANVNGFEQLLQLHQVARGVVSLLSGKSPSPVTVPWNLRFLYWTILLMPLLMLLGIVYSWRHWRDKGVGHILLTLVLYGSVALLWLFGVPQVIESPLWSGIRPTYPDLAYTLLLGATLGIGWSVIYTVMIARARRRKLDVAQR